MIGKLTIPNGPTAVLNDAGVWECSDALLARYLAHFYPAESNPARGAFGVAALYAAAEHFSADGVQSVVELEYREPHPPGTVY